jgi:hypothetical protein
LAGLALFLGGCASFDAHIVKGHSMAGLKHFFIITSPSDNHALDHRIAEALQARGLQVDIGPLTMMPDDAQAVVTYQDRWSWDFGEHLVYMQIDITTPDHNNSFATVNFTATVPLHETPGVTVGRLVNKLFDEKSP